MQAQEHTAVNPLGPGTASKPSETIIAFFGRNGRGPVEKTPDIPEKKKQIDWKSRVKTSIRSDPALSTMTLIALSSMKLM